MDVHGRELRYFVTVAEELHFTHAAERLFVSQPALRWQFWALYAWLGALLFGRGRWEVWLTLVGVVLLPRARRVLAEWDTVWEVTERVKG